jgi:hypothetical protein
MCEAEQERAISVTGNPNLRRVYAWHIAKTSRENH